MSRHLRLSAASLARFRLDGFTLLLTAIAALGAAQVILRQAGYGVGLGWDAVNYIFVARSLLTGDGFFHIDGSPYTLWAPLYPALIAAGGLSIFDPHHVAGPLNVAVFALTVFVVGRYLRRRLKSRFVIVWACLAVALSPHLAENASWAMTETLFSLLAVLALIHTEKFLDEGKRSTLIWAAAFSALAWLTRYTGADILLSAGLLLIFQRGAALTEKAKRIACYSLIAAVPMALWLLRNFLLIGEITGNRRPVDYSIPVIARDILSVFVRWADPQWNILSQYVIQWTAPWLLDVLKWTAPWLPDPLESMILARAEYLWLGVAILAGVASIALAAAVGCVFLRWLSEQRTPTNWRPLQVFGVFALVSFSLYAVALLAGSTWHGVQGRHLIHLYIPLLFIGAFTLDRLLSYERERRILGSVNIRMTIFSGGERAASTLAVVLITALSLWTVFSAAAAAHSTVRANRIGAGYYNRAAYVESETLRRVRENPIETVVFSNNILPLQFYVGAAEAYYDMPRIRPIGNIVDEEGGESITAEERLRRWLEGAPDGAYVVWFHYYYATTLFDYDSSHLRAFPGLEPVADMADGIILKVNKAHAGGAGAYRSAYESIASGEPVARSDFDVYLSGSELTYLDQPCGWDDPMDKFFLHVVPVNADDVPKDNPARPYGFHNMDFWFRSSGARFDGKCMITAALPDYEIASIRTGQFSGDRQIWKVEFALDR